MAKKNGSGDYEVGYGKPPKHSRFKPGQCGNPKGRPKGSRNRPSEFEDNRLRAMFREESERQIEIWDAKGKKQKIMTKRAVLRAVVVSALKGQQRSQRLFIEMADEYEREERDQRLENFQKWAEYKRTADPLRNLPDPRDVKLDLETADVKIAGPAISDEVPVWDRWRKVRDEIEAEVKEIGQECDIYDEDGPPELKVLVEAITSARLVLNSALDDGNRTVMNLLECLDRSEIEAAMQSRKKGRKSQRKFVLLAVYKALHAEYRRRTS